jgi:hypothetical protein
MNLVGAQQVTGKVRAVTCCAHFIFSLIRRRKLQGYVFDFLTDNLDLIELVRAQAEACCNI